MTGVQGPRSLFAVFAIVLLIGGAILIERRQAGEDPPVELVPSESDSLPETLRAGDPYRAVFTIEWLGPIEFHEGLVSIYASRLGGTTEDAPDDGWPLVCETELDQVLHSAIVACPFDAPGPGEFALQLKVDSPEGEPLLDSIYVHDVVEELPEETSADG
jgi:hypothetical protein